MGSCGYRPDWTGELLADMGGPKAAMFGIMRKQAAAAGPPASAPRAASSPTASGDPVARGTVIFQQTAGGVGCASCHGKDARGNPEIGAPDIRGAREERVRAVLAGVTLMSGIRLNDPEIAAVVAYLQQLGERP